MITNHSKSYVVIKKRLKAFYRFIVIPQARPSYELGNIQDIVDNRLRKKYNASSMCKVAKIAMACVQIDGIKRPTMDDVCNDLKDAIRIESNKESLVTTICDISKVQER